MHLTSAFNGKAPITRHPAFPAILALWFAALLGLGSMVIPIAVLDRVVDLTGIAAIIPAAQPPLGFTARALIAVAAAAGGAIAGVVLARRLAARQVGIGSGRQARIADTPRPINAHEELGEEGLLATVPRRRSFTPRPPVEEDAAALEPQPEQIAQTEPAADSLTVSVEDDAPADRLTPSARSLSRDEHLFELFQELEEVAAAGDAEAVPPTTAPPAVEQRSQTPTDDDNEGIAMTDTPDFTPTGTAFARFAQDTGYDRTMAANAEDTELDDIPLPQLLSRLSRSLERRRQKAAKSSPAVPPAPTPATAPGLAPARAHVPPPVPAHNAEALAGVARTPVVIPPVTMEPARPEEAAQAMAAYFGKPAAISPLRSQSAAMPAAFRADFLSDEDDAEMDEGDDLTASLSLPRAILPDSVSEEEEESDGYPSLLSIGQPTHTRQMFIPVEETADIHAPEQSSDILPGAPAPAARDGSARLFDKPEVSPAPQRRIGADTDEALRSVLERLQRMNGAN